MSLRYNDLAGTILPKVSIDVFNPNAGTVEETIVVAFYATDRDPALDLNTFIQRGMVDVLDSEVSPNSDEDGRYLLFVEFKRSSIFLNKFKALVKDIENVTGKQDWKVVTYLSDGKEFDLKDDTWKTYLILDPKLYKSKDKMKMQSINEEIQQFFKDTLINDLTFDDAAIKIHGNGKTIVAEVVDVGEYRQVIERNFLKESGFNLRSAPYEAKVLESVVGNCEVYPIGDYLSVIRNDKIAILENAYIQY